MNKGNDNLSDDTFFDIHLHTFDLSHPSFSAFLKRFQLFPKSKLLEVIANATNSIYKIVAAFGIIFAAVILLISLIFKWPLVVSLAVSILMILALTYILIVFFKPQIMKIIRRSLNISSNLLAVFENDIGSFFLIIENCLREDRDPQNQKKKKEPHLKEDGLHIGKKIYNKLVLTPLMIDFGQKGKVPNPSYHYGEPSEKPIMGQVADVFHAVERYCQAVDKLPGGDPVWMKYPHLTQNTMRLFEVYPFLGINTQNYKLPKIQEMLQKYFGAEYNGSRNDLRQNLGEYNRHIDSEKTNFFAGIKVYPPLGFDPWPDDRRNKEELDKVKLLYDYCANKGIPITVHGGSGGFVGIEDTKKLLECTSVSKWETVLSNYNNLKLNIAHFPAEFEDSSLSSKSDYKQENQRLNLIITLIANYPDVYTDISCRATNKEYYKHLKNVLESSKSKTDRLENRILFGSDYAVVIGSIDSYYDYIKLFSETGELTDGQKHALCCINPQLFLFKQPATS